MISVLTDLDLSFITLFSISFVVKKILIVPVLICLKTMTPKPLDKLDREKVKQLQL